MILTNVSKTCFFHLDKSNFFVFRAARKSGGEEMLGNFSTLYYKFQYTYVYVYIYIYERGTRLLNAALDRL